jgi:hypothetical protein
MDRLRLPLLALLFCFSLAVALAAFYALWEVQVNGRYCHRAIDQPQQVCFRKVYFMSDRSQQAVAVFGNSMAQKGADASPFAVDHELENLMVRVVPVKAFFPKRPFNPGCGATGHAASILATISLSRVLICSALSASSLASAMT